MFFKLIARKGDAAYVEILNDVFPMSSGRVYCVPASGIGYFANAADIYEDDPEIIHSVGTSMVKIKWRDDFNATDI